MDTFMHASMHVWSKEGRDERMFAWMYTCCLHARLGGREAWLSVGVWMGESMHEREIDQYVWMMRLVN